MQIRQARRRLLAASAAVSLTLVLAACGDSNPTTTATPGSASSASATPTGSATPVVQPTPSKDLTGIEVSGDATPSVKVPAPWGIATTTVKVLKEGTSTQVVGDGFVQVNYVGVNGRTGETFDTNYGQSGTTFKLPDGVVKGFSQALIGQKVGSRVLVGIASADGYPEGQGDKIAAGDSLVFVMDILAAQFTEPQGAAGALPSGAPQVSVGDSGPTVTVPAGLAAPTALGSYELIKGVGRVVTAQDTVVVRYRSFTWDGTLVEDGWASPQMGALSGAIQGWNDGLVGKTTGSRVVLTVPPSLAYPDGRTTAPTIAPGQALIYVIDLFYAATS